MRNLHRRITVAASALFLTISLFILSSCPVPLTRVMVQEVKDEVSPVITVTSPLSGDAYGAYTLLTGTVTDLSNHGASGKVTSITVSTPGKDQSIPVNDDGSFTITLETNGPGYDGDIIVVLTAVDWNNNVEKKLLGLKKAAGDIVGFEVSAGNKEAEISWEALPGAESYSIDEFRTGQKITGITETSYIWNDLGNGNKCSFMVSAELGEHTFISSIKEVIPLSETTLAPMMESVYRGINLQWKAIPAASEYVIERAGYRNGPYSIRTITPDSYFSDTGMERDSSYFYRVYPVERMDNPDIAISVSNYGSAGYYHGQNDFSVFANYDTPNSAFEVAIQTVNNRKLAYVADGVDGMVVLDITDPSNPFRVGSCETKRDYDGDGDLEGNAGGIALASVDDIKGYAKYACLTDREVNLVIIDIDPDSSTYLDVVGFYDYDNNGDHSSYGVAVSDNYAYITIEKVGLVIVDISDPSNPIKYGSYEPGSGSGELYSDNRAPRKIVLKDDYAYLASRDLGLEIIDISNPGNPFQASMCNTEGDAVDVWVSENGEYAYLADGYNKWHLEEYFIGLKIVDISDPSDPSLVDGGCTLENSKGVTISEDGNRAYVANGINGLAVIDVSEPEWVTDGSLIGVCDTPGDAQSPLLDGDYAYVTDYNSGLEIIDVSSPLSPSIIDDNQIDTSRSVRSVTLSGDYLSIADGPGGYIITDVSDPSNIKQVGSWQISGAEARGVAISGKYAYVVDYFKGLQIIDISNPSSVSCVATCDLKAATPGRSYGITVYGSYAYVAEGPNGLQIVDISDPLNPLLAGLSDTDGTTLEVAVSGHYAYLADKDGGLKIIDVSDPYHPVQIGNSIDTFQNAYCVTVAGNIVYVGCEKITTPSSDPFKIYDISDPAAPVAIGSTLLDQSVFSVKISGSLAFLAMGTSGIQIVDISDPRKVSSLSSSIANILDVAVSGNYIYIAGGSDNPEDDEDTDTSGGIQVIDLAP